MGLAVGAAVGFAVGLAVGCGVACRGAVALGEGTPELGTVAVTGFVGGAVTVTMTLSTTNATTTVTVHHFQDLRGFHQGVLGVLPGGAVGGSQGGGAGGCCDIFSGVRLRQRRQAAYKPSVGRRRGDRYAPNRCRRGLSCK